MRYHLVSRQMVDRFPHMNHFIWPEGQAQMRVRRLVLRRIIPSPLPVYPVVPGLVGIDLGDDEAWHDEGEDDEEEERGAEEDADQR